MVLVAPETDCLRGGDFAGENFRDSKVSDLEDRSLLVEHDVLSLEISVKDVERVDVLYGHQQLSKELQNVLRRRGIE